MFAKMWTILIPAASTRNILFANTQYELTFILSTKREFDGNDNNDLQMLSITANIFIDCKLEQLELAE